MIKTAGEIKGIINNGSALKWAKDYEIDSKNKLNIGDAPNLPLENGNVQKDFASFLMDSLGEVNRLQNDANIAIKQLATGKNKNIHETMLMVEKADLAFRTMNQIRSKVLDAYREVMKMQI